MNRLAHQNPFGHQLIDRLSYRFPDGNGWRSNIDRLSDLDWRACVMGVRGTGKSTLLRQLKQRFDDGDPDIKNRSQQAHGPVRAVLLDVMRAGRNPAAAEVGRRRQRQHVRARLNEIDRGTVLLVDGIERLTWLDQLWLVRHSASRTRCAGLVVNLHRPAPWLGLRTWVRTDPTPGLLQDLLEELDVASPRLVDRSNELFRIHKRNIREVLRELYDDWAMRRI